MEWNDIALTVGGAVLPAPISFTMNLEDYDGDSVRDVKRGILDRIRIRDDVSKITLKYGTIDVTELSIILNALNPAKLTVQFYDAKTKTRKTINMYCNKKSWEWTCTNGIWSKGLSIDLVEY
jgi:hypothetical protein